MSKYSRTGAGFGSQTASRTGVARSWGTESGEWPDQVWALGSIRFSHQASAFCSTYEIPPLFSSVGSGESQRGVSVYLIDPGLPEVLSVLLRRSILAEHPSGRLRVYWTIVGAGRTLYRLIPDLKPRPSIRRKKGLPWALEVATPGRKESRDHSLRADLRIPSKNPYLP